MGMTDRWWKTFTMKMEAAHPPKTVVMIEITVRHHISQDSDDLLVILITVVTSDCCSVPGDWVKRSGKILVQLSRVAFKSAVCPFTEFSSAPVSSAATPTKS
jgi:hypothetical protein